MILQSKPLAQITEQDVRTLLDNQIPEGKLLDYKSKLPGLSDADKKEFLFDVSSFANASGGFLVYGVEENGGMPTQLSGLVVQDADAEIRRLQNCLLDAIEPRIPGLELRFIPGSGSGAVLIVAVPRSWALPHMVTFKGTNKFYSRNSAGKHPVDVNELRGLFASSDRTADQLKRFRSERLTQILADEMPFPVLSDAKTIVHIIPLQAFSTNYQIDLNCATTLPGGLLYPLGAEGHSTRINLDGLLNYTRSDSTSGKASAYLQLYRNGIIETVDARTLSANFKNPMYPNRGKIVPSTSFEQHLIAQVPKYLLALEKLRVDPPFVIMLALTGVKDFTMAAPTGVWTGSFDRDVVCIPGLMLEKGDCKPIAMRPVLDAVWNATGVIASPSFDKAGNWVAR